MRVTYMTSVNHTLAPNATVLLHAYNFAPNPRKPAQTLAFAHKTSRKFGRNRVAHAEVAAAPGGQRTAEFPPCDPSVERLPSATETRNLRSPVHTGRDATIGFGCRVEGGPLRLLRGTFGFGFAWGHLRIRVRLLMTIAGFDDDAIKTKFFL